MGYGSALLPETCRQDSRSMLHRRAWRCKPLCKRSSRGTFSHEFRIVRGRPALTQESARFCLVVAADKFGFCLGQFYGLLNIKTLDPQPALDDFFRRQ